LSGRDTFCEKMVGESTRKVNTHRSEQLVIIGVITFFIIRSLVQKLPE